MDKGVSMFDWMERNRIHAMIMITIMCVMVFAGVVWLVAILDAGYLGALLAGVAAGSLCYLYWQRWYRILFKTKQDETTREDERDREI